MEEIRGKSVLILGYGREGQSTHRFLTSHYPKLTIGTADQKDGKNYLQHLSDYTTVIRSPGIPAVLQELADYKKQGGWVTSGTNIFFSECQGITIGITGTKGKSTTASLITHILHQKFPDVRLVGNIGRPMLDFLEGATQETVFVIELSSHQLEDIRYSPHIAVVLAIVPEHLDYYSNFEAYVRAKANIVRFQRPGDAVVFNPKNEIVAKIAAASPAKKLAIAGNFAFSQALLKGNRENILAGVVTARYMGVPEEKIMKAIKTFKPLPHRLEFVGEYRGIQFYNDSLSTIPEATIHALEALSSDVETLIAGGFNRKLDFSVLGNYLAKHPVKTLILFPDTGAKIWDAFEKAMQAKPATQKYDVTTMEEAVKLAYKHTSQGRICLLSPASASFNLFKDYEDRGNQFKKWVMKLGL